MNNDPIDGHTFRVLTHRGAPGVLRIVVDDTTTVEFTNLRPKLYDDVLHAYKLTALETHLARTAGRWT